MREIDDITAAIVDASLRIHRDLGPGLLESVDEALLAQALVKRGFDIERQVPIRFQYDGLLFDEGFRTDIIVDGQVIVELKSVERLGTCPWQTTAHISQAHEQVRRPAHQVRRRHSEGRPAPHRQSPWSFLVSAPPREPIGASER